jgi:hypothetical protein
LATPPPNLQADVAQWEQSARRRAGEWTVLAPREMNSTGGAALAAQSDQAILASGTAAERDTYAVTLAIDAGRLAAIRLEALPHESLPSHGPGRAAGGEFVLSEISATVAPQPGAPVSARYVRIENGPGQKLLSLAEVQVFAGQKNVARAGKATQSSTFFQAPAELAIDGDTDGDFDRHSVTHTADEEHPWWEVDLGRSEPLTRVVVWNRTDHALEGRLRDFRVMLLDESRCRRWGATVSEPPKPSVELKVDAPIPLQFHRATADLAQADSPPGLAIDSKADDPGGWRPGGAAGQSHYAIFALDEPLVLDGPGLLNVRLSQAHGGAHTLGRFRLSVWTAPSPPPAALPARIGELLAIAPESRSTEMARELIAYYWANAPATDGLRAEIASLESQIAAVEKEIATTPIMRELPADKQRVTHSMVKGNFRSPGEAVTAAVPAAFHPLPPGAPLNRLGLAQWLVDPHNPLTARVSVNRFWSQLFGVGLVATEEDFGTQGLPPTHPQVLDLLAVEFQQGGWNVKDLLRQIVCSATYRQSSTAPDAVLEKDPSNRHLARGPRFRLEAELVRDQALAIAGLLSGKQGGPSVYPPQPPNLWRAAFNSQRTWATSTGADRYRRGVYTFWRRTVPYPSMAAFDAPSRETCTLRRISTNTPLQAFVTLNDPVYVEAAQALARRMLNEGGGSPAERAAFGLRLALVRPPDDKQAATLVALYDDAIAHYRHDADAAMRMATDPLGPLPAGCDAAELAAWTVVSNVILNLDGVLTRR